MKWNQPTLDILKNLYEFDGWNETPGASDDARLNAWYWYHSTYIFSNLGLVVFHHYYLFAIYQLQPKHLPHNRKHFSNTFTINIWTSNENVWIHRCPYRAFGFVSKISKRIIYESRTVNKVTKTGQVWPEWWGEFWSLL